MALNLPFDNQSSHGISESYWSQIEFIRGIGEFESLEQTRSWGNGLSLQGRGWASGAKSAEVSSQGLKVV
ncbi:hypothetical protein N9B31_09295 [Mariniblastus sp.]|nr:hypothetical protein [Mariniblastus sp.]MDA7903842.1 hypothetical protein [Mariniblastus sp.]MDA7911847.1 hypothetical protein [bacterium]MDB4380807.1 hypothetical protein [Mariniblastus sp.]